MVHSKVDENYGTPCSRGDSLQLREDSNGESNSAPYTTFRNVFEGQEDLFLKSIQIFRVYTEMLNISVLYRSRGVSRIFGGTLPEYGVKICKF